MAMYYFDNKIVSRGKNQSSISKSAYNSASKIKDYKTNEIKDFSIKECDYSRVILPENAPEEFKDREYLWNSVEQVENRKDSRLAREIVIALPTELDNQSNIKLAEEFGESLAKEGMIVDMNIHHINKQNPHAHLLCTLRGLDKNGNFEPKRIGNKKVRDWDSNEKNLEWRKRWADIQNKHLKLNGVKDRVSHNSYNDQNIDLKPTKKEGWKSRKFERETGKKSKISKYNDDIRKQNQDIIKNKFISVSDKISTKENVLPYLNKEDTINLKNLAKTLKLYVNPINIYEENEKVSDLKNKALLLDPDKREIKLNELDDRSEQLNQVKDIFETRALNFFKENYPKHINNFSNDEMIYITDHILNNESEIPDSKNLNSIVDEKRYLESQKSLNIILGNRDISLDSINKEDKFFSKKINNLLKENNLTIDDVFDKSYKNLKVAPKIDYYMNKIQDLKKSQDIINDYYSIQIKKFFPNEKEFNAFNKTTTPEEKEELIDMSKFYGKKHTIDIIKKGQLIPKFTKEERKEITHNISLIKEKENKTNLTQLDKFVIQDSKEKLLDKYNINPDSSNDLKYISLESEIENDEESLDNIKSFTNKNNIKNNDSQKSFESDNSSNKFFLPISASQFTNMMYAFSELFKERMPKYIKQSDQSQTNTSTMSEKEKRRRKERNRGGDISL